MNYYEHHIGDYAAATAHLSLIEDAVYTRMLRRYYLQEQPLPSDVKQTARLVGARTPEELEAVEAVLSEFFHLEHDGWHQTRCDADIARYLEKQSKAKASAEVRWGAKPKHSERNANAMPTHSEGNAHQTPDTKQKKNLNQKLPPTAERQALDDDPLKLMIDGAIAYMADCQIEHKQARSLIGMLRKAVGDLQSAEILATMQQQRIANPAPWLRNAIQQRGNDPRAGPKSTSKNVAAIHELEGMKHGGRNPQPDFGSLAAIPVLGLGRAASG